MNNQNKIVYLIFVLCVILFSCRKYVDIKSNSAAGLLESAKDCQLLLDDVDVMNKNYPADGNLSSDDFAVSNSGYLASSTSQEDRDIYTWSNGRNGDDQWRFPYYVVYRSNLILEALEKLGGTTDEMTLNSLKGSALFFRSFAFWQLAQLYGKQYIANTASSEPGIPLRLKSDINEKTIRATLNETYLRITTDLIEAANLLQPTSIVPTRPNRVSAHAMLARVYLSMNDYANAMTNADAALKLNSNVNNILDYNAINAGSGTPFAPKFNKEVIFHSVMAGTTFSSASANNGRVNQNLVNAYSSNDLRGQVFFQTTGDGPRFKGNYSGLSAVGEFFNGLAVDELLLIRAECHARANNIGNAMEDLNSLLIKRWKAGTYTNMNATTSEDAISKIVSERRKELVMRGLRWTDLRRLNGDSRFATTLSRSVTVNNVVSTYTLLPNDPRYTLLIPTEVIRLSGIAQNQR